MGDGYTPIRGKCVYWREAPHTDDEYDMRVRAQDKRVKCSCFVEGHAWTVTAGTVPADCPLSRHCRYFIRAY